MQTKALVLALVFSSSVFAATKPRVTAGQCTIPETREVIRLRNVDPNLHYGKFAEADSRERVHIQLATYETIHFTVWGGVSGAHGKFAHKAPGVPNPIRFNVLVNSPYGKRHVRCNLIVLER